MWVVFIIRVPFVFGREFAGRSRERPAPFTIESFHQLDLARLPCLVEPRLQRAIEAQDGVPAFAGMRSGIGTKSGKPAVVTFSTKAMMDCLALPSFHEGNGSAANAMAVVKASAQTSAKIRKLVFMVVFSGGCGLKVADL